MMKRVLISLLLLIGVTFPATVSAHVLKTDGNIGVVIHIDPDDDPIVGSPAYFFLDFKDKTGKLDLVNCDCQFTISENGKEIYSTPATLSGIAFTFQNRDVYQIKITGTPKEAGAFQDFSMTYDTRVSRILDSNGVAPKSWLSAHTWHILTPVIIAVITIIIYILIRKRKHART